MTTTEDKINDKMVDEEESDAFDTEKGKLGDGMRQRNNPNGSAAVGRLSITSQKFDVENKGSLNQAQQAMRDMDSENFGYLTNEKVYKVMLEQMKLQQEIFGLKRMSMIFLVVICLLSLATLGTSFAAATLAKDTDVVNGVLVVKDNGGVIGTGNVGVTFAVREFADTTDGRSLVAYDARQANPVISSADASTIWDTCLAGTTIQLERQCVSTTVEIAICSGVETLSQVSDGIIYTYMGTFGDITIKCPCADPVPTCVCSVVFPTLAGGGPTCLITPKVDLGTAGNYAILAQTGITTTGTTFIKGDIAVSPIVAASMTGFGLTLDGTLATSTLVEGSVYASDYLAPTPSNLSTAVGFMGTAYTDAAGRVNPIAARKNILGGELADVTMTPGVYTFTTDVNLNGDITFTGTEDDVFIIQMTGSLKQAANYNVILAGSVKWENIFWQVAGLVEVGAGAHMEGVLLVKTSVTFITGSSLNGRVLTQTACNLQSATIN